MFELSVINNTESYYERNKFLAQVVQWNDFSEFETRGRTVN